MQSGGLMFGRRRRKRPPRILVVADVYGEPDTVAVLYEGASRYSYFPRERCPSTDIDSQRPVRHNAFSRNR
jgi:hypothetical protein